MTMSYSFEFLLPVSIKYDHDSLYVNKVKPVSKTHAQSCNRNNCKK